MSCELAVAIVVLWEYPRLMCRLLFGAGVVIIFDISDMLR